MPRQNFNDGQEVTYEDLNAVSSAIEKEFYDRIFYQLLQQTDDAFCGGSFLVTRNDANHLDVAPGFGMQNDFSAISPEPKKRPLYLPSTSTLAITTPDETNDRIDIVCVKYGETNDLTDYRYYKGPTDISASLQSFVLRKDKLAIVQIVVGTPDSSPSVPSTPSGFIKIAEVYVTATTGVAASGAITDKRNILPIGGSTKIDTSDYLAIDTKDANTPLDTVLSELDELVDPNADTEYTGIKTFDKELILKQKNQESVTNPGAEKFALFFDSVTGLLTKKKPDNSFRAIELPEGTAIISAADRAVNPGGTGSDTTLENAISNLPEGGGIILLQASVTLDTVATLPDNTILMGKGPGIVLTIGASGKLKVGKNCVLREFAVNTANTSGNCIELNDINSKIQNCVFSMPSNSTGTMIYFGSNDCDVTRCSFSGASAPSTGTALEFASGTIDNTASVNVFSV